MAWKLTRKAKEAEARAQTAAQGEAMYIARFLREQAADIIGNAISGVGNAERCEAASEVLELAAEMIENGEYKK
jgi:hypothetical protein